MEKEKGSSCGTDSTLGKEGRASLCWGNRIARTFHPQGDAVQGLGRLFPSDRGGHGKGKCVEYYGSQALFRKKGSCPLDDSMGKI